MEDNLRGRSQQSLFLRCKCDHRMKQDNLQHIRLRLLREYRSHHHIQQGIHPDKQAVSLRVCNFYHHILGRNQLRMLGLFHHEYKVHHHKLQNNLLDITPEFHLLHIWYCHMRVLRHHLHQLHHLWNLILEDNQQDNLFLLLSKLHHRRLFQC